MLDTVLAHHGDHPVYANIKHAATVNFFKNKGTALKVSIYKFGLSVCLFVCLFVCLYPINVKRAEPIGPKFFVGHDVTTGKVYE